MMIIDVKTFHRTMNFIFWFLCILWVIVSLSGCNLISKYIPSESTPTNADVTLVWTEIPNATSYNVYVSKSPGVTKRGSHKISSVTNPFRLYQLEPDQTYYFVVTVVNASGESQESKELSYYAVADEIGLVYWKNLFDKSIQDHARNTAETKQAIVVAPEGTITESDRAPLENKALGDKIARKKIASVDLSQENLQSSEESGIESASSKEQSTESSKPKTVSVETGTDQKLLELEDMRLKAARMLAASHFYIFFEENSNELTTKALEKLDHIYTILIITPGSMVTLNGYSDSIGAPSLNRMVSEVRANSVKSYLSGKGIKPSRMMALGHGSQKFLASNDSAEGRRFNRRVEIELIIP
jgi:outer membrane protein OmpA-like peptidoglycan-associated protein